MFFLNTSSSQEIRIGTQIWSKVNLNVTTFRNGDPIPEGYQNSGWDDAGKHKKPVWSYYQNTPANGKKYGKLYNWYAVNDPRGLAPKGWHIPSVSEWETLIKYLGGKTAACLKLRSKYGWDGDYNGNNSSGFNGLPAGLVYPFGTSIGLGTQGAWWCTTELSITEAWGFYVLGRDDCTVEKSIHEKNYGISVRCIKD